MQSEFDTTTKLLFVLTGFMVIMAGLVMYVALFRESGSQFAAVAEAGARAPDAPAGEACDATSLEGSICPDGKYCRFDTCVPITQSNVCAEGESCRECECDTGLVCYQFRCTAPARVDWKPLVCEEDERLSKAVLTLADKCNQRKRNIDELASAKGEEFLPGDDLAKYALDKPKITVSAKLTTGTDRVLLVSRKDDLYYAKVSDRADVYKIASSVFDQLNTKLDSLRSKDILKLNRDELTKVWIRNPNTTISTEKKDEKWIVDEPADKKGKDAFTFKLFDPLETKATEVMDKPSAAAAAKLAKPAVEVRLTYKDGKTTVVKVSSADGDNVYVRVEGKSGVYKVGKSVLDSLSFKLEEAVSPS